MVESMSVVLNVMYLMSVMSPPPALCNLSVGDGNSGVGDVGCMDAGCERMDGTRGLGGV